MATAAPHVKLLRQLANARDDYLSGALDITWEEGRATLFLVFGQPSHAQFESAGRQLEGDEAVAAMQADLPHSFAVGAWRRTMSPKETLHLSMEELAEPFVEQAGTVAVDNEAGDDAVPEWWTAEDDSPALGFGVTDFPLLPTGEPLWEEAPAALVRLEERLATLPAALIVLNAPRLRAAGVVSGGDLIDAVWVDANDHASGETAAIALLGAGEGTLSGYRLELPDLADSLPALWRYPKAVSGVQLAWIDADALIDDLTHARAGQALLIDAPERGVALYSGGKLVAVYTETHRTPTSDAATLRSLLTQGSGTLQVLRSRRPAQPAPMAVTPPAPVAVAPPADDGRPPRWYAELEPVVTVEPPAAPEPPLVPEQPPAAIDAPLPPPVQEPVPAPDAAIEAGSDYVDYAEVKRELGQIAVGWLGDGGSAPVAAMIQAARPSIDDFVSLIDTIRGMTIEGIDPSAVQAMAREMHHHAAERLCGA